MTRKQRKILIRIVTSAVLLVALMLVPFTNRYLKFACFMVPYLIIGYDILIKAVKGIFRGHVFDENFLMAIATVGAVVIAFTRGESYAEAVAVMLFYQLGEMFQSYAVGKSRRSIAELMDIRPDCAVVETENGNVEMSPDEVEVGNVIIVAAGEKIPIDGVVAEGESMLNTSALTGESVPRSVSVGSEVISGCINENGLLKIRTTKPFGESTVSRILDLVENSATKKSKSEKFITKFARYYTPAVCAGALLLAVLPPLVVTLAGGKGDWGEWIYRALTFLVISCPCALVISIPLSFFGGIGCAGKNGILIKGSSYLETLSKTKCIVFDKTGTMTKGVFEVNEVLCADGFDGDELLKYAAYAEAYSSHPISESLRSAYGESIDTERVSEVNEIRGNGVTAKVDGKSVAVGNTKLMDSVGAEYKLPESAGTLVFVAVDGTYAGCIVISDVIKGGAKDAVSLLRENGVERVVMLTGDRKEVAESVAGELGVDEVKSELLPEDKVAIVEKLLDEKGSKDMLAFVGDGINDAPVLTRADIGIAMGALGSDAAIEAADIVLMDDDPRSISKAIGISRKCLKIVYENIIFALAVKAVCLILGAFGIANMWLAIFADVGVMVIAVLNAIRCLKIKK